jgi:hypothetical protein
VNTESSTFQEGCKTAKPANRDTQQSPDEGLFLRFRTLDFLNFILCIHLRDQILVLHLLRLIHKNKDWCWYILYIFQQEFSRWRR